MNDKKFSSLLSTIGALITGLGVFVEMYFVIPSIAWRPQQIPTATEVMVATVASVIFGKLVLSFGIWLFDKAHEDTQG